MIGLFTVNNFNAASLLTSDRLAADESSQQPVEEARHLVVQQGAGDILANDSQADLRGSHERRRLHHPPGSRQDKKDSRLDVESKYTIISVKDIG